MNTNSNFSPRLLLGVITLIAGCVVVSTAGLWLAGEFGGFGPLAPVPTSVPAVAVVNDQPITLQQLDDLVAINLLMTSLEKGQPMTLTPQQWQQARNELLNQVIRNTLILQAARSAGITVSQDMMQAEWLAWLRKYELTPTEIDARLAQAGTSQEVLQEWLGNALAANLYLRQYVAPGGEDQEREKAYQQWIEQQLATAQIQVYQIPVN
ncbi:MAG: SurA N-terminal domain-containing protein [Anaerolineae bacterium]